MLENIDYANTELGTEWDYFEEYNTLRVRLTAKKVEEDGDLVVFTFTLLGWVQKGQSELGTPVGEDFVATKRDLKGMSFAGDWELYPVTGPIDIELTKREAQKFKKGEV